MSETTPDPADVHTGTDRVELTDAEKWLIPHLTQLDAAADARDVYAAVGSIVAARVQALTAERDELRSQREQIDTKGGIADLFGERDQWRKTAERYEAELAAANARCAELKGERDVLRGPWRDSLAAWNRYNEGFGYRGDFDRPIMAAFRTGFDTGRAERDALQATLDRVTAVLDEYCTAGCCQHAESNEKQLHDLLRAALTPEGKP